MVNATSTAPAACAGAVTFIVTALMTCTLVAETPPNFTVEASADVKPAPISVTTLPPAGGTAGGSNGDTSSSRPLDGDPPRGAVALPGLGTPTPPGTASRSWSWPT